MRDLASLICGGAGFQRTRDRAIVPGARRVSLLWLLNVPSGRADKTLRRTCLHRPTLVKRRSIQHALDKSPGGFSQVSFSRFSFKQGACNVLCNITRPSLDGVKSHHSYWIGVLAVADIVDDSLLVNCCFIGFDIGATKLAKVIEHDVHCGIGRLLVRS